MLSYTHEDSHRLSIILIYVHTVINNKFDPANLDLGITGTIKDSHS